MCRQKAAWPPALHLFGRIGVVAQQDDMDLAQIARAEELRQALTLSEIAGEWIEVGGGRAARGEPGIWANIAMNLGLAGPVSQDDLERIIDWYTSAGIEPRFEICPYVPAEFLAQCEAIGLVPRAFENIFWRPLERGETIAPGRESDGLEIRTIDPDSPDDVEQFADCVSLGFASGEAPHPSEFAAYRRVARHQRTTAMIAMINGQCAGGGAVDIIDDIASLFAMSVLPRFRRRGIQQALMAARLEHAASRGARFATIGARPGIPTNRNAMRMGFRLAYTKVVLVKPGPALVSVRH
jgi:GNAT superfamily N-acetyltransferase